MSTGFWFTVAFVLWGAGGFSIYSGFFAYDKVYLGISGILLVGLGFYLLILKVLPQVFDMAGWTIRRRQR